MVVPIEPFEIEGKTIRNAFYRKLNAVNDYELILEFTDHSSVSVRVGCATDEISGNTFPINEVEIFKQ